MQFHYTSHELRIGFQCKGSCKGPYTLTAVSDYNAWYNETLNSFFLSTQQWSKQNGEWNPFVAGPRLFQGSWLLSWQQHFLHNNVFMTLVLAGGLLANMGGQDSLRQRQNTHSAIYLQEQKTRFLALTVFFFPLCFATKMQIAYVAHKAPITWPTKNNFLYLIVALLSNFDRLELKG